MYFDKFDAGVEDVIDDEFDGVPREADADDDGQINRGEFEEMWKSEGVAEAVTADDGLESEHFASSQFDSDIGVFEGLQFL